MDNPLDKRTLPTAPPERREARTRSRQLGTPLGNLKVWQKLALITAAIGVPLIILVTSLVVFLTRNLQTTLQKDHGAIFLREAGDLVQAVPQHRGITNTLRSGNETVAERRAELQERVNADLTQVSAFKRGYDRDLQITDELTALEAGWREIESGLFELPAAQVFNMHTAWLQDSLFPTLIEASNTSGLKLDSEQEIVYLTELVTRDLPNLTEVLGRMRGFGAGVLARGQLTEDETTTLRAMATEVNDHLRNVDLAARYIFEAAPELQGLLALDAAAPLGPQALTLTDEALLGAATPGALSYDSVTYFDQMTEIIDAYIVSYNSALDVLSERLDARATAALLGLLGTLGLALPVLSLIALLVTRIARQISRPIDDLVGVAKRVGQGDLSRTATVGSTDEIGTLGVTFNNAILQLRGSAERDRLELERSKALQGNIGNFLDVAMDIAEGDFTKRGTVSEDALGNVVDAINLMVEELNGLLQDVQTTAFSVRDGAGEMIQASGAIGERSRLQVTQAQGARDEVQRVTSTMLDMAKDADASADAARRALTASQQGEAAVQSTLTGMQGIRREVQGISKRVKGLGDRSLEISEIVDTISRISRQTNLLALNAAIEAAGAGETGGRFAIVANEVRKLADDSASATQRVAALIKTVQSEVQEVVGSVEGGTREVEEGYRVATEAGERLREIGQIVTQAAEYAQNISAATQQQVLGVEQVSSAVESIAGASEASQEQVAQGGKTAQRLEELAAELANNLSRFRLA